MKILDLIFCEKDVVSNENIREATQFKYISKETLDYLEISKKLRNKKGIYYLWHYDIYFRKILSKLKDQKILEMARLIAYLSKKEIYNLITKYNIEYIIPIPISNKRYLSRGFNQVEIILDYMNIKYLKIIRIKETKKMRNIYSQIDRKDNIKKGFIISNNLKLDNKNILIIDDVITTGATINELKNYLKYKYQNININVFCFSKAITFDK